MTNPSRVRWRKRLIRHGLRRIDVQLLSSRGSGVGYLRNISKHGAFIRSSLLLRPGTQVRLLFSDTHGRKIQADGTIRWHTRGLAPSHCAQHNLKPGFGLHINRPSPSFRAFYEDILTGAQPES